MKPKNYAVFATLFFAVACDDYGPTLCEAYPQVLKEISENRALLDAVNVRGTGRQPASSSMESVLKWSEGLMRKLQWARDHFEGDRKKEGALRKITDAADDTLFLMGYLEQGRPRPSLERLQRVDVLLKAAYAEGCGGNEAKD